MKLPYTVVTNDSPFLYLNVVGIDFTTITTTGDTYLSVYRVDGAQNCVDAPTDPDGAIHYMPLAYVAGNKFTFVLDGNIFNQAGGRFRGDLYYKGTYIDSFKFVYNKISLGTTVSNV